jgi:DNA-binding transcriptional ArsR family regulator
MRPLFHPAIEDVTVEGLLHALSDPLRVAIFADIAGAGCGQNCSNYLNVGEKNIPKSTLSQHFKVLREAGLIRGERNGVEMHNTSRCMELHKRFPGLIASIISAHQVQLRDRSAVARKKVKSGGPRPAARQPS